jgi:hypothetical protein
MLDSPEGGIMNNKSRLIATASAAALVVLVVAGCASTQSMSDSQRKALRSVAIAKNVPLPPQPVVMGKATQTGGFWGGPIVMAAMMNSENSDVVKFKDHLAARKVDLGNIVRQEFASQLTASKAFPAIVNEGADATFELTIVQYGLAPGFSISPTNKPVRPTLNLMAKLIARDGNVLWQKSDYVTGLGDLPAYQVDEYYAKPGMLEDGFKKAAQLVVKDLLKDIASAN